MDTTSTFSSLFFWEGLLYIMLGSLMLLTPFSSSLGAVLVFGTMLVISGVMQIVRAVELRKTNITTWPFVLNGIVSIITGSLLLYYPFEGLVAITVAIASYLGIKAVLEFIAAIVLKMGRFSWWLIANSLILILLDLFIWKTWPDITLVLLGLLIGVDLISSGMMRIMLGVKGSSLLD